MNKLLLRKPRLYSFDEVEEIIKEERQKAVEEVIEEIIDVIEPANNRREQELSYTRILRYLNRKLKSTKTAKKED